MKLRPDTPLEQWQLWHQLLISYNDLASSEYRNLPDPSSPANQAPLQRALKIFEHHVKKYVQPGIAAAEALGFRSVLPHASFVVSHCEAAVDYFTQDRFRQVVKSLEEALTNYHEFVDGLQPPHE